MHFPVSGVDVCPLIPPLVAFLISSVTTTGGISGAFLLLSFQVSVLGFVSPAVSPTNLIYTVLAAPGGLARYIFDRRMAWPLARLIILGMLPGVIVGAWIRVRYLTDPGDFKLFLGLVLMFLGGRLLYGIARRSPPGQNKEQGQRQGFLLCREKKEGVSFPAGMSGKIISAVKGLQFNVSFEFRGEKVSLCVPAVFLFSLVAGLIGGICGIGGGVIIAPFCVSVLGLPVSAVAGAALAGAFFSSVTGVTFYALLASIVFGSRETVSPDWSLGVLFGAGGFLGTYCGAYLQRYLPERLTKGVMGVITTSLAFAYILRFFI